MSIYVLLYVYIYKELRAGSSRSFARTRPGGYTNGVSEGNIAGTEDIVRKDMQKSPGENPFGLFLVKLPAFRLWQQKKTLRNISAAPAICFRSPGLVFFSQIRVGQNGRRFNIYKFRSMYMGAEERKKELVEQGRVKDGLLLKMEFNLRVIGNKILSDDTKKTGNSQFIRDTSLDEFPQFWNELKGEWAM